MNVLSSALPKVLLVDDDDDVCAEVSTYLGQNGFTVRTARDAGGMEAALLAEDFPIMVLDVMLPGEDGLSICRRVSRAAGPSIIMLSAMTADVDRIVGLEIGATDYLSKPCNPRELLARIRAILRRRGFAAPEEDQVDSGYRFGGYYLDAIHRRLRAPTGVLFLLSSTEFSLLSVFLEHPRRILTRDELVGLSQGRDTDARARSVDVSICRLRRKLRDGVDRELIQTYRGRGYMLDASVSAV